MSGGPVINEDYDVVVLGTGLKECILSGLFSVGSKKVIHLDRNRYYGAECASVKLDQLYEKFLPNKKDSIDFNKLGKNKDYNVDLCPKFIISCGDLVKILSHTKVFKYLQFKAVAGCYVYHAYNGGTIYKVPANPQEALTSGLVGFWQKNPFRGFLTYVMGYDEKNKETWRGFDWRKVTMRKIYEFWELNDDTIDFTGHSLALFMDDAYMDLPAKEAMERIKLYAFSLARYGQSPFIYPMWGLSNLPEGFSRLSAVYGGTYVLGHDVNEIVYDDAGKVSAVKFKEVGSDEKEDVPQHCAFTKKIVADPSYFVGTDKVKKAGQVARWIFIKDTPIADTDNADSCQIILPQKQTGRKSDVYISMVSEAHQIAPEGKYVAMIQANVETGDPKKELEMARKIVGPSLADFFWVSDFYVPVNPAALAEQGIYITTSYDSTSHFESATEEVISMYETVMGSKLDLEHLPLPDENAEDQEQQ